MTKFFRWLASLFKPKKSPPPVVPAPAPVPPVEEPSPVEPTPVPPVEVPVRSEPIFAINTQPMASEEIESTLRELTELKVKHIRMSYWDWSHDPAAPGNWNWCPKFLEAGIEILPIIYPHRNDVGPNGEFSGMSMAHRYRQIFYDFGPFPYIQLGNEVDGDGHFGINNGDPYLQGLKWANQMNIAIGEIRKFQPDAKFVSAGVAWNREGVTDFVRAISDVADVDVIAIHTYGVHIYGEPLSRYKAVREQGWNGPIWVTEWGVSITESNYVYRDSPPVSLEVAWERADAWQTENWVKVLTEDESRFGYERMYGFQLPRDSQGWGISGRPAFEAVKKIRNP